MHASSFNLASLLSEQVTRRPDAPAILTINGQALDYAGLWRQVQQIGMWLGGAGVAASGRVAVVLPNGPAAAVAFLGVASCAACAPLNPAYTAAEFRFYLGDTGATAVLLRRDEAGPIRQVALEMGLTLLEIEDEPGLGGPLRLHLPRASDKPSSSFASADATALVLHTSGTTARPKIVPLSHAQLLASARAIAAHLALSEGDRCLNVMPLFHIHGLVGALLASLSAGGSVVCTPGFDEVAFFDWIAAHQPSWTTAVPTMHQAWVARGDLYREKAPEHRFRFVRSSSAALPPSTLRALHALTGAPVVEAYGMTEASHQMASNPLPPGMCKPGSVGLPAGAEIAVMDQAGQILERGAMGEVVVRGPGITHGYENNADANASAFHNGWFRTGDQGRFDEDGYLFLTGRLKEIVNRGGEKISPREVDEALLEHPDVLQAVAYAVPHPTLGEDLAAVVVLRPGAGVDEPALRDHLFSRLAAHKVPSTIKRVSAIPKGSTGKIQRNRLHALLASGVAEETVPLRGTTEQGVADVFESILGTGSVGAECNFFALGGDSLKGAMAVAGINRKFGIELPVAALFRHPTVRALASEIARRLDELQTGRGRVQQTEPEPIMGVSQQPRTGLQRIPLAPNQRGLWFLNRLEPESATYNMTRTVRLTGPLDVQALRRSMVALVERHEAFRTRFVESDDGPVQWVTPDARFAMELVDFSASPPSKADEHFAQVAQREARTAFSLDQGPLLRAKVVRLGSDEHRLLVSTHHIVADDWSFVIFWRELSLLYEAFLAGQSSPLPPLAVTFADHVDRLRKLESGNAVAEHLDFWKRELADLPSLELPTDHARPLRAGLRGQNLRFSVERDLAGQLQALSRSHGTTLFSTVLAALQVLLSRHSGQDDFAIGIPVFGREAPEWMKLIGYFVNMLVIRGDLSGSPSFVDVLHRVAHRTTEAYAHQEVAFDVLVKEVAPARSAGRNPFFQASLIQRQADARVLHLTGHVPADVVTVETGAAAFELSVSFVEQKGELHFLWEYASDLFEAATIERMAGHFRTLLEGIVADPDQEIGRLPLLTAAERRQILVDWNDTAAEYPRDQCIHQLFEEQVRRAPDAVAVVYEDRQLSYAELNARANQLAHHLIGLGVGPEVLVAICVERSLEMVVGLLGILKAGGAYVPLDPGYPKERLAFMLQDTQAPVLLTQERLLGQLPAFEGRIVCLERDWDEIGTHSPENPQRRPAPTAKSLAYVIYTSGSTGQPKGVALPHRNVANFLSSMTREPGLCESDRLVAVTSLSFDISVLELFLTFTVGAQIVVASHKQIGDGSALRTLLEVTNANVLQATPTTWRLLLDAGWQGSATFRSLVGGEALPRDLAKQLLTVCCELWNMYGPTETTIWSTCHRVNHAEYGIPIGRPISNTQAYILDRRGEPCPIGVVGELFLGGDGLARGYLNRPELTAEKFVPDPFSEVAAARMYRTGDLVRYLADGTIEFLGRIDNQVKIRGFRIELGEIEAVLARLPAVQQAVVIAREDTPGDKRLVAYVVSADGAQIDNASLRAHLQEHLPDYMRPTAYVMLERLPLTPNGKVDRRALPAPRREPGEPGDGFIPPRTPVEQMIAEVWCDVLKLEQVSVHANFFELGGHSLLAAQVAGRLNRLLKVELPLREFFDAPSVAALAAAVGILLGTGQTQEATPVPTFPRSEPLTLSFAQQRLWFLDRLMQDKSAYNIPVAWRVQGELDQAALQGSLDALMARHEVLRTHFVVPEGQSEPLQIIEAARAVALRLMDLSTLEPAERESRTRQVLEDETRQPFDLETGPVLRAQLLRLGEREHLLVLNVHHIAADGWSMGVLCHELSALYAALSAGKGATLAALPVQYADYAQWQRQWLQGDVLQRQLSYWKTQLAEPPTLALPADRPRPSMPSYRGERIRLVLPAPLMQGLKALGRQEGATPYMTLLAALQVLLARYTAQDDIVVGSPIAGRTRSETEGLIGLFVNTLVLRGDLSGAPSFRELLNRVRDVAVQAFTHQDVPFEKLVEEIKPDRDARRNPLFQVMFVLQNAGDPALNLQGLDVTPVFLDGHSAKFDLSLVARETEGELHFLWEYATDLFEAATIERMAGHFRTLLEGIVADPDQEIGRLPMLTAAERQQILVDWNDTAAEYPRDQCIHWLFEEQVRRTPDAVALVYEEGQLGYGELNARANQLAHHLIGLGVGPEVRVGICVERSPEMVVCLLGILKAGGAYVPLDPDYPKERLTFMLKDSQAPVLLTQQRLLGRLTGFEGRIVCLEQEQVTIDAGSRANPDRTVAATDAAYIIYTSGSTGQPKGVVGSHRAAVNRFHWMWARFPFAPEEVCCQKTALSFVDSVWEVFGPLLKGVPSVVIADGRVRDPDQLVQALAHHQVTRIVLVPSLLRLMLDAEMDLSARLPALKFWVCSGEAFPVELLRKFHARLPRRWMLNLYGSSEVAADATAHVTDAGQESGSVPIGRPIANMRTYVLDANRQPVPPLVAGELYLAGDGLADGYFGQPALTAQRFVADPFSDDPAARLFRSGDLARYLEDGNIEYLGRMDHQVKIRGFRIELGEVETVLARHPAVRQAVVLARAAPAEDVQLVAYVVADEAARIDSAMLRGHLNAYLPDYMCPAAYVMLERLPLLPNGKVDRQALPAPGARQSPADAYIAPRDDLEQDLSRVWAEVLGVGPVGVNDSFFDLGGHSLKAVRLTLEVRRQTGHDMRLAMLFEAPTVAKLAGKLRALHVDTAAGSSFVAVQPLGRRPPLFVLPGAGGELFSLHHLGVALGSDQPLYVLNLYGLGGGDAGGSARTLPQIAARIVHDIRQLQPTGPYQLAGYSLGGRIAYEVAQQLRRDGQALGTLIMLDSPSPGFFRKAPLRDRIAKQVRVAASQGPGQALGYFARRLQWKRVRQFFSPTAVSFNVARDLPDAETLPTESIVAIQRSLDVVFKAWSEYHAEPYRGDLVLLRASWGEKTKPGVVDADPYLGWKNWVRGDVELEHLACWHSDVLRAPHAEALAGILRRRLALPMDHPRESDQ